MNQWDGTLNIDTPENVVFGYEIAGIGSRFIAAAIDTFLIVLLQFAVYCPLAWLTSEGALGTFDPTGWLVAALGLIAFLFFWGYYIVFEVTWNGQTPGKRQVKLRVVRDDGTPVTLTESAIRNLVRIIDFLPFFYTIGIVTMFIDRQSRRLGDLAASTLVVHDRKEVSLDSLSRSTPLPSVTVAAPELSSSLPLERLTPEDFHLAEEYMSRRYALSNRDVLAGQLVQVLYRRMDMPVPPYLSTSQAEGLLADIVRAGRRRTQPDD